MSLAVDHKAGKVTVEGVNEVQRHIRRSQKAMQGGRLSKNMPVPAGKVMFVCPACGKPARVGYKFQPASDAEGAPTVKVRFCKKCNAVVVEAPFTKKR